MQRADVALERALYDTEDIDMDSVFLAIDAYRNSILLTNCGTHQWVCQRTGLGCCLDVWAQDVTNTSESSDHSNYSKG